MGRKSDVIRETKARLKDEKEERKGVKREVRQTNEEKVWKVRGK